MSYTSPAPASSGTTFAELKTRGASGLLEALITANLAGTSAPGDPTVSATGGGSTGGNLAAGTYYVKVTETNGIGETTANVTEKSFTSASGNIPQITFAALQTGNIARNVYVGDASGAETLYASGITTGTYNLSAAMPTDSRASITVPTSNTTGKTVGMMSAIRAAENNRLQGIYDSVARVIGEFSRGEPVGVAAAIQKLRYAHTTFALLAQLCAEAGVLIDANPGSFGPVTTPIGTTRTERTWA